MKKFILYTIALFGSYAISAQDTLITESDTIITNTGKIEVDQVEVIKAFKAKLDDAKKIGVKPTIIPVTPTNKTYQYDITIVPIDIEYPAPTIRPLAMNPDGEKNVDNFYAKLGYGNLSSPYADLSYQAVKSDEYDFLISGHYYATDDSEEIKNRKFSESNLSILGGYRIGENNKIRLDLNGNYDTRFLYDTSFARLIEDTTNVKRNILNLEAKVHFQNIERTQSGLDYNAYIMGGFLDLSGRQSTDEVRFGLGGNISKSFSKSFDLFVDTKAKFANLNFESLDNPLQRMITLKPGFHFSSGQFTLKAAADVFFDNNSTNPFIEAEAGVTILENSLQVFIGVDQKIHDNTFATRFNDNPFVSPVALEQRNTINKQFYGGVKGKLRDLLSFNFTGGYEDIKDQRYDSNRNGILMRQLFDQVTNVFVNASIEFNINKNISVGAVVNQNFFNTDSLESPINISEYSYNTYAQASLLNNKLKIRTDLDLGDKIFWINQLNNEVTSGNTLLDFSVEVDFYFTKNVALWARANNIFDREYLRYHFYPGFGRNLLGGLIVKF